MRHSFAVWQGRPKNGPQARRLLALAAIYDGATRTEAAKIGGVGLQIIRDWVLRFDARGPLPPSPPAEGQRRPRVIQSERPTAIVAQAQN